jgi:DNA ligase (NAD+)
MLSILSTTDKSELSDRLLKMIGNSQFDIIADYKADGLALELVYGKDNLLSGASTRGDGIVGDDVLSNARYILNVVPKMSTCCIYGEVVLSKKNFKIVNDYKRKIGDAAFTNARNAASGILRSSRYPNNVVELLTFIPYGTDLDKPTHTDKLVALADAGFITQPHITCTSTDDIIRACDDISRIRNDIGYDIDGIVFKVNDVALQQELCSGNKHPNHMVAYKFPASNTITTLNEVVFQVGRTGRISPVGIVTPVTISGILIKRVSLHNINDINDKDLKIGDKVILERAGDVIPAIIESLVEERTGDEIDIVFPTTCPTCHSEVAFDNTHYTCTNDDCLAKLSGNLMYAIGRKAFNMKGIGPKVCDKLVACGLISDVSDLFTLDTDIAKRDTFMNALGISIGRVNKLLITIDNSRVITFAKFIKALSIPMISDGLANSIANKFTSIDNLLSLDPITIANELSYVPNIGRNTVDAVADYFDPSNTGRYSRILVEKLIANGVIVQDHLDVSVSNKNVVFVITGKFDNTSRVELAKRIDESQIGIVERRLTGKTKYLVVGDSAGKSKVDKAVKMNIPMITLDELNKMIQGAI